MPQGGGFFFLDWSQNLKSALMQLVRLVAGVTGVAGVALVAGVAGVAGLLLQCISL